MNAQPLPLIRPRAPMLSEETRKRWLDAPAHPALAALLDAGGLTGCTIGTARPAERAPNDPALWWHHGYAHPAGPRLDIAVPAALVEALCTIRFGGAPSRAGRARRGGAIEARLAGTVAQAVLDDLPPNDWLPTPEGTAEQHGLACEVPLRHPLIAACSLVLTLTATEVVLPPEPAADADWQARLQALGRSVRLPLRAVVARPVISAGEVVRLAIGDVLPIRAPDRVTLLTGRQSLAAGRLVESDGHAAVEVAPLSEVDA